MGQFALTGDGAGEALSALVSNRILDMKYGEVKYTLLLNDNGGVIDDLLIYKMSEDEDKDGWFIVVNAGNRAEDFDHFKSKLPSGLNLKDLSEELYLVAVQGPNAHILLDHIASGIFSAMPRFTQALFDYQGMKVRIGRTGYTGEEGAELYFDAAKAEGFWTGLLEAAKKIGVEAGPVGLAARDSLRFEAGMPLHGHEISPTITPLEAMLSWACDFEKDFAGKQALLELKEKGLKRKLAAINVTGGVPRHGYPVLNDKGEEIGVCASGMFCPSVGTYAANVLVPPEYIKTGTALGVKIRDSVKSAVVVKRPLYIPVYRR
jgi:glycine cleavage system T protein